MIMIQGGVSVDLYHALETRREVEDHHDGVHVAALGKAWLQGMSGGIDGARRRAASQTHDGVDVVDHTVHQYASCVRYTRLCTRIEQQQQKKKPMRFCDGCALA